MTTKEQLESWFHSREASLTAAVSRLVRIESTLGEAAPGMPFGPGPAAALKEFLAVSGEWGLPGEDLEGYVGVVDLSDKPDALHILGHLDVVPAGEGWTVTEPFEPKLIGGLLYGRGASDDKGPMVAALLAMRAVKELDVPLTKNVRLILGTDEETGMRDVEWYYGRHPHAPNTLSPDADFPIINIEKGHYQPVFGAKWQREDALPRVTAFSGGPRVNMVPPKASATVLGLDPDAVRQAAEGLTLEEEIRFTVTPVSGGCEIRTIQALPWASPSLTSSPVPSAWPLPSFIWTRMASRPGSTAGRLCAVQRRPSTPWRKRPCMKQASPLTASWTRPTTSLRIHPLSAPWPTLMRPGRERPRRALPSAAGLMSTTSPAA